MKSAIALTDEIDDPPKAVAELSATIRAALSFGKSSVGIVYCDAEVAVSEIGRLLHESLGIDIVGLTATASIERHSGYHDMGIMLVVITGDDVDIAVGSTGALDKTHFAPQIAASYYSTRSRIPEYPRLILLYVPYITDPTPDNCLEVLDELSGHTPVFGGVASDHYDLMNHKTFHNGEECANGMVFVLISGNVHPVFALEHHFEKRTEHKGIITKSSANQIERVGDKTFKEYLSNIMSVPNSDQVIYHFQSTPFVMEMPDDEDSGAPVVRELCMIDHKTGAGGFQSKIPEGSALSITELQRENLRNSCGNALDRMVEAMRLNQDYPYCLILISTCNARNLLMGDTKNLEATIVADKLSGFNSNLNAMGFYALGEICPTASKQTGHMKNRFHNFSFSICAF